MEAIMEKTRTLRIALELLTTKSRVIIKSVDGHELYAGPVLPVFNLLYEKLNHEVDKMFPTESGMIQIELNE